MKNIIQALNLKVFYTGMFYGSVLLTIILWSNGIFVWESFMMGAASFVVLKIISSPRYTSVHETYRDKKPLALYNGEVVRIIMYNVKPNVPEYILFYTDSNDDMIPVTSNVPIDYTILKKSKHPEYFL